MGFSYERGLPHQVKAIQSINGIFEDSIKQAVNVFNPCINPVYDLRRESIKKVQKENAISIGGSRKNIFDIMMETGTGKTYTYTKMMYELHKNYGFSKFVLIVPSVAIRLGALKFLESSDTKKHFRDEYDCNLSVYALTSQKDKSVSKKRIIPSAISHFVKAENSEIHVLIINHGMLTSNTMETEYDRDLFEGCNNPFDAISNLKAIGIIDEPHRFKRENTGWEKIEKLNLQMIFRYGATFDGDYENLIYELNALEAFRQDLVKGIITEIQDFEGGDEIVRLKEVAKGEASFELISNNRRKIFPLNSGASLGMIHSDLDISLDEIHPRKKMIKLSNGLEMKIGDKINPYSYNNTLKRNMMESAIRRHFELEKELLNREVKIKPLTLFFVENREDDYRNRDEGSFILHFEQCVKSCIEQLLNEKQSPFYEKYLQKTLKSLNDIHGGYFSKDNQEKDEKIQAEIDEILRDKEKLLSLNNVRRFIFSKWTLREGWDNPNIFQICKLRKSGSLTSKLQEVGRGLRIPVNEYMARVKDERFYLHYCVDFTERDFANHLRSEINLSAGFLPDSAKELSETMIDEICRVTQMEKLELLSFLDNEGIIDRSNAFKDGGYEKLKRLYPQVFAPNVLKTKIRDSKEQKKLHIRREKYSELKELWEKINKKAFLSYKVGEKRFEEILKQFFEKIRCNANFRNKSEKLEYYEKEMRITNYQSVEDQFVLDTMPYGRFLITLSDRIGIHPQTLHKIIKEKDLRGWLNEGMIRSIKVELDNFLLNNSLTNMNITYQYISANIHPTFLTNEKGEVLSEIEANKMGGEFFEENPADNYLFEEIFADNDFEVKSIIEKIDEVRVFTKIPKNSIRIPIIGGRTYSPDFAFVIKKKNGDRSLHLIIEAKGKNKNELSEIENTKIKFAQKFFNHSDCKVFFETQFADKKLTEIIREVLDKTLED